MDFQRIYDMQGRKRNEVPRQFSQWSNNILHFIALISLLGSIILLFLSYIFYHRLKDTNDDGYLITIITLAAHQQFSPLIATTPETITLRIPHNQTKGNLPGNSFRVMRP